jgi:hypothetical protein
VTPAHVLSRLFVPLIFFAIGYYATTKITPPQDLRTWKLLITALIAGSVLSAYIGIDTTLIHILGFAVYLNALLQGLMIGLLTGILIHYSQPGSS